MPGWAVGQLVVTDADVFPNAAPFSYTILSSNAEQVFRMGSDGSLYTAARLNSRLRSVFYLQLRVTDSGFSPLHTDTWLTVKVAFPSYACYAYSFVAFSLFTLEILIVRHNLGSVIIQSGPNPCVSAWNQTRDPSAPEVTTLPLSYRRR